MARSRHLMALLLTLLGITPAFASPSALDLVQNTQLFKAFVRFNLNSFQDLQGFPKSKIYFGRPEVHSVGSAIDGAAISTFLNSMAADGWFVESSPSGTVIVVAQPPREAAQQDITVDALTTALESSGYEHPHAMVIALQTITLPGPVDYPAGTVKRCSSLFADEALAIIVSSSAAAAQPCVEEAVTRFQGLGISFDDYAVVLPSDDTIMADKAFLRILGSCVTGGIVDDAAKSCVLNTLDAAIAEFPATP